MAEKFLKTQGEYDTHFKEAYGRNNEVFKEFWQKYKETIDCYEFFKEIAERIEKSGPLVVMELQERYVEEFKNKKKDKNEETTKEELELLEDSFMDVVIALTFEKKQFPNEEKRYSSSKDGNEEKK